MARLSKAMAKERRRLGILKRRNDKLKAEALECLGDIRRRLHRYIHEGKWGFGPNHPAFVTRILQKVYKAQSEVHDFGTYWQRPQPPRKKQTEQEQRLRLIG